MFVCDFWFVMACCLWQIPPLSHSFLVGIKPQSTCWWSCRAARRGTCSGTRLHTSTRHSLHSTSRSIVVLLWCIVDGMCHCTFMGLACGDNCQMISFYVHWCRFLSFSSIMHSTMLLMTMALTDFLRDMLHFDVFCLWWFISSSPFDRFVSSWQLSDFDLIIPAFKSRGDNVQTWRFDQTAIHSLVIP